MEAYCLEALKTGLIQNKDTFYVLQENKIITHEQHTYVLSDKYNISQCKKPQRFAKIENMSEAIKYIGK